MKKTLAAFLVIAVGLCAGAAFAAVGAAPPSTGGAFQQLAGSLNIGDLSGLSLLGIGMTTLAADVARAFEQGDRNDMGVIAADIIYEGAAVGDNASGYARPLVAGDPFRGFATEKVDNSAGLAGAAKVWLRQVGRVELAIGSLAITDVGKPVYASDDATFTLTAASNSYIGRVIRFVSSGIGVVEFDASKAALGSMTALTDNTTGAASDTLAAITDAATKNAVASLAAKVNALIAYIK